MQTKEFIDDLNKLLELLPEVVRNSLESSLDKDDLLEIVLDLGRFPEARFSDRVVQLGNNVVSKNELQSIVNRLGRFGADNRAGIERTLHRISAIRNRQKEIVGLTCRVGRAVYGTVAMVRDLIETGESLLLMGRPGVGKTTALREIARVMADELALRVVIIDTSNEIAGDGDIPHPAIGRARRMQVARPENQHQVMIEAVENHMPQVIVIDEIGTELEAFAARTIAERGVQLIATAHGNSVANLIKNPTLCDLIGGIQSVTLGDEEARRRRTQKTVLERASEPTFSIAIEMNTRSKWLIHSNVSLTVDSLLRGQRSSPQERELVEDGSVRLNPGPKSKPIAINELSSANKGSSKDQILSDQLILKEYHNNLDPYDIKGTNVNDLNIFSCGIANQLINEVIKLHYWPVRLVDSLSNAHVILSLRNELGKQQILRREAKTNKIPIYIIKSETMYQIERAISRLLEKHKNKYDELRQISIDTNQKEDSISALEECRLAIEKVVLPLGRPVELLSRPERVLRMQSDLAARYRLKSDIFGHGNNQRLRVYPP